MAKVNLDVAQRLDITCRKGDSFELNIDFGIGMADPSNAVWSMHVLESDESTSTTSLIDFQFTVGANDDGFDYALLTITATFAEMQAIDSGTYVYDLELLSNQKKVTHLYGLFIVNEDVTA